MQCGASGKLDLVMLMQVEVIDVRKAFFLIANWQQEANSIIFPFDAHNDTKHGGQLLNLELQQNTVLLDANSQLWNGVVSTAQ